ESGINNFWIKYKLDFDYLKPPKIKNVKSKYKNFMIWGQKEWGECSWGIENPNTTLRLPRIRYFKALEIEFYNTKETEDFNIKSLEFSEVEIFQS
ncbi:hypothetical protein IJS77_03115, partial [bacterium]|nr:hypothetical protein [bacterium]